MGTAGVAQLSNRMLVPPDGLTFRSDTAGEFLGIAWMALPLIPPTGGSHPVGNQSWTFFVNSTNFQGPVAFYVPDVWEVSARTYAPAAGRGLDARPGVFAGGFAMEMGMIPFMRNTDSNGTTDGRLPRLAFPTDVNGRSYLASDFTFYSSAAIFGPLQAWLNGGTPISGQFDPAAAVNPPVSAETIYMWSGDGATRVQMQSSQGLSDYVSPSVVATPKGGSAWTLQWKGSAINGVYPEYYQNNSGYMRPIPASQVPDETGLKAAVFPFYTDVQATGTAYTSPASWASPGPAAGPVRAQLTDGSTVTYAWYRFIDQPALQGFGWTVDQKNNLQAVVEQLHTQWKANTQFMAPQTVGELVSMDAALIVIPPAGLEIGYVPIVLSQRR